MSNVLEMFCHWEAKNPDRICFRQPTPAGWKTWSYSEAGKEIRKIASGIKSLNLPQRSKVALLSKNCAHWIMADLAVLMSGNICVPLYPTLTDASIRQILEHSESKAIIVGKLDDYKSQRSGIPSDVVCIGIETYSVSENLSWDRFVNEQSPIDTIAHWTNDEVATIIYTSGTTGGPKGVMHSLGAFDSITLVAITDLKIPLHPRMFSYLPLSHIAERVGVEVMGMYQGAEFSFAETLETFPKNLFDTQPDLFFAVPRIWAKFQEKILEKIPQKRLNLLLSIPIVKTILKKSIRKKLGLERATHIYTGAAPITVDLLKWYDALGITIYQALGMTEDSLYSHFNREGGNRFGTVGKRLTGLQVKLSEESELRTKSPGLFKGYFKDATLTAKEFDEEGFFRTGDLGEIDHDGYLTITGRIKDQFKTDKGKYISPAPIEMRLLANADIEQVAVVGMGIPQPIALVVLSALGKTKTREQIIQTLTESLETLNPTLQTYEKLEKAVIMKSDWTIGNGLLTPSLKVKRNEVEKIFLPTYPEWYKRPGLITWE